MLYLNNHRANIRKNKFIMVYLNQINLKIVVNIDSTKHNYQNITS